MKLECIKAYYDTLLERNVSVGTVLTDISEERANILVDNNVAKIISQPKEIKTTKAADVLEEKEVKVETAKLVNSKIKKSIKKK